MNNEQLLILSLPGFKVNGYNILTRYMALHVMLTRRLCLL